MTYAVASTLELAGLKCSNCNDSIESQAKFCGSCGYIVAPNSFNILEFPEHHRRLLSTEVQTAEVQINNTAQMPQSMPSFALPKISQDNSRNQQLQEELNKILVMLARERVFLYIHLLTFLAINLFGCWVAWKCYFDFIGDEMSKMMIASTPFLFINSLALMMLIPIKGTRSEIAQLKERLSHARFNLEFGHLNL